MTTRCLLKAPPSAWAPGSLSPTGQVVSKAVQSIKPLRKFQKLQVTTNSMTSSINSKKSDSQLSTIKPEFGTIKTKTLSELEEDLERLLEDTKQETSMHGKILSSGYIHFAEPSLRKKKSKTSFKKTTRRKKPSEDIFSKIDKIDEKIEHCLQLAEDTFNHKTSYEEFSNPGVLALQSWNKIKHSLDTLKNSTNQSP